MSFDGCRIAQFRLVLATVCYVGEVPSESYREQASRSHPGHQGEYEAERTYWVSPDPAIGDVLSAWSNQRAGGFTRTPAERRANVATMVLGTAALAFVPALLLSSMLPPLAVFTPIFAALFALAWWSSRPRPECSYVGVAGVESHTTLLTTVEHRRLLFADAASMTQHTRDNIRHYIWRDGAGMVFLRLRSIALSNGTLCDGGFAEAAAKRWNEVRLERARAQLTSLGHATFSLGRGVSANITSSALVLFDGARQEIPFAQIESLLVLGASLTLSRKNSAKDLRYSAAEAADLPVLFTLLRERGVARVGNPFSVMADSFAATTAALANLEGVRVSEEPEDLAEAEVEPGHGRKSRSKEKSR